MILFFEFFVGKDVVLAAPLFAQKFIDIVSNVILEDTNYSFAFIVFPAHFLDVLQSCVHDCSWRTTHQKTLVTNQVSCAFERTYILSLDPVVALLSETCPGNEVIADAFDQVGSCWHVQLLRNSEDAAERISSDYLDFGVSFFYFSTDSSDGASSSDSNDDRVDVLVTLVQNLFSELVVVC